MRTALFLSTLLSFGLASANAMASAKAPAHFITSQQYFGKVKNEGMSHGGYPPQTTARSQGLIVVTPGLRTKLGSGTRSTTAHLVVSRDEMPSLSRSMNSRKIAFEQTDAHFGTGWLTLKVSGKGKALGGFLSSEPARADVRWAGEGSPERFVREASKWFTRSVMMRNESW